MADMIHDEPQSASDYPDRTTSAVKSVLKKTPPIVADFAVQRADGADLALRFYQLVAVDGPMPDGGVNRVDIAVCSIPALIAMKGHALQGRLKQKDAFGQVDAWLRALGIR